MVQHSFWHQRVGGFRSSEPRCPICMNEVRFHFEAGVFGWRCFVGHELANPVYVDLPPQTCPFPQLHSL